MPRPLAADSASSILDAFVACHRAGKVSLAPRE
jgi:hypothetical protein